MSNMYINPLDCTQAEWLKQNASPIKRPIPKLEAIPEGKVLIAELDNGAFKAVAVVRTKIDYMDFTDPIDARECRWFLADEKTAELACNPVCF